VVLPDAASPPPAASSPAPSTDSTGPGSSNAAGSMVIAASRADAIPIAPTGPRPRVWLRLLSSRQSRPMITVAAEAPIGSTARRHASHIASYRSSCRRSSSR